MSRRQAQGQRAGQQAQEDVPRVRQRRRDVVEQDVPAHATADPSDDGDQHDADHREVPVVRGLAGKDRAVERVGRGRDQVDDREAAEGEDRRTRSGPSDGPGHAPHIRHRSIALHRLPGPGSLARRRTIPQDGDATTTRTAQRTPSRRARARPFRTAFVNVSRKGGGSDLTCRALLSCPGDSPTPETPMPSIPGPSVARRADRLAGRRADPLDAPRRLRQHSRAIGGRRPRGSVCSEQGPVLERRSARCRGPHDRDQRRPAAVHRGGLERCGPGHRVGPGLGRPAGRGHGGRRQRPRGGLRGGLRGRRSPTLPPSSTWPSPGSRRKPPRWNSP